MVRELRCVY